MDARVIRMATAEVVAIVDGDTFHSRLDIGWGVILLPRGKYGAAGTIRVVFPDGSKYDAPEYNTKPGKQATAYILREVAIGARLEVTSHGLDDFGRTLGSVTLPSGFDWATALTSLGFVK